MKCINKIIVLLFLVLFSSHTFATADKKRKAEEQPDELVKAKRAHGEAHLRVIDSLPDEIVLRIIFMASGLDLPFGDTPCDSALTIDQIKEAGKNRRINKRFYALISHTFKPVFSVSTNRFAQALRVAPMRRCAPEHYAAYCAGMLSTRALNPGHACMLNRALFGCLTSMAAQDLDAVLLHQVEIYEPSIRTSLSDGRVIQRQRCLGYNLAFTKSAYFTIQVLGACPALSAKALGALFEGAVAAGDKHLAQTIMSRDDYLVLQRHRWGDNEGDYPRYPLSIIASAGSQWFDLFQIAIEHNADVNMGAIHAICKNADYDWLAYFLGLEGVDVNLRAAFGNQAIHYVCSSHRNEDAQEAIRKVQLLLVNQANINAVGNDYDDTPLHLACEHGKIQLALYLIEQRASIEMKNDLDKTPFCTAIAFCSAHGGARVNSDEALELIYAFLNAGAITDDSDINDLPYIFGALHSPTILGLLLERGANANWTDEDDNTLLHRAMLDDHLMSLEDKSIVASIISILVRHGIRVDEQNMDGDTALHLAMREQDRDAIRHLIAVGASLDIKNYDDMSPVDIARSGGIRDILQFIREEIFIRDLLAPDAPFDQISADILWRDLHFRMPLK